MQFRYRISSYTTFETQTYIHSFTLFLLSLLVNGTSAPSTLSAAPLVVSIAFVKYFLDFWNADFWTARKLYNELKKNVVKWFKKYNTVIESKIVVLSYEKLKPVYTTDQQIHFKLVTAGVSDKYWVFPGSRNSSVLQDK